jgi:hypothetical protein
VTVNAGSSGGLIGSTESEKSDRVNTRSSIGELLTVRASRYK